MKRQFRRRKNYLSIIFYNKIYIKKYIWDFYPDRNMFRFKEMSQGMFSSSSFFKHFWFVPEEFLLGHIRISKKGKGFLGEFYPKVDLFNFQCPYIKVIYFKQKIFYCLLQNQSVIFKLFR